MSPLTATQTCLSNKYANFSGRAGRSEFWGFTLIQTVAFFCWLVLVAVSPEDSVMVKAIMILGALYCVGTIVPTLAVSTRRLHDIGLTGWVQLLAVLPPLGLILIVF